MAGAPNPGIWGESVRKALNPAQERDADERQAGVEQMRLDEADLRELEQTGSFGARREANPPSRLTRVIARLFRRRA